MRRLAFTLAETLMTFAIIGVIAAITLPNLNSTFQDNSLETSTAKMYNRLQEAISRYMYSRNVNNLSRINFNGSDFIRESFIISSECLSPNQCFANSYRTLAKTPYEINFTNVNPAFITNDGMTMHITNSRCIIVDLNGEKGPNVINRDLWQLHISNEGLIEDISQMGSNSPANLNTIKQDFETCSNGTSVYGCFAHFITNGFKFDY